MGCEVRDKGTECREFCGKTVRIVCLVGGKEYGMGPHLHEPEDRAGSQVLVT